MSDSFVAPALLLGFVISLSFIDFALFNGFQKKARKTPVNEINKALKIKEESA